jgi:hypothetical protein
MIEKIHKYILYTSLYYTIKDKEIRKYFYENTRNKYIIWDYKKFDKFFELVNKNYDDIEKTYTNIFYLSLPETIILFLKDEKMLSILEKYKKGEGDEGDEGDDDENKLENYNFIYEKLHYMYPNRF